MSDRPLGEAASASSSGAGGDSLLSRISELLNVRMDRFDEVLEAILDASIASVQAELAVLLLLSEKGEKLVRLARNARKQTVTEDDAGISRSVMDRVLGTRKEVFIPDILKSVEFAAAASVRELKLLSVICIPLKMRIRTPGVSPEERRRIPPAPGEQVLGALYVSSTSRRKPFTSAELETMRVLANNSVTVLVNAELFRRSSTDPQTALLHRSRFEQIFHEEVRYSLEQRTPIAVLMIDIDYFKDVNQIFGHQNADQVIGKVSELVRGCLRRSDLAGRYGGEAFVVLLTDTDVNGASRVAANIRKRVQDYEFFDGNLALTVSVGLSCFPGHTVDPYGLIRLADQALYQAKKDGRNRVAIGEEASVGRAPRLDRLAGVLVGDPARDYRNVEMLLDTIEEVSLARNLDRVLVSTVDKIIGITEAERGFVLLGNTGEALGVRVGRDRQGKNLPAGTRLSRTILKTVLESLHPVCIMDTGEDPATKHGESVATLGLRAVMAVPLVVQGRLLGVIYVDSRAEARQFGSADLDLFIALAREIAIAIDNARLHEENLRKQEELQEANRKTQELYERLEHKLTSQEKEISSIREILKRNQSELVLRYNYENILGKSKPMRDVFRLLDKVVDTEYPVLVEGESGSGKELVARAIHFNGSRKEKPFIAENCAALADSILESELFGHVRGAFTGADRDKKGLFELADGGTLFLDEVGDMSLEMQKKLLRVLEEREIRPVGAHESWKVDVRLVAATHRDLDELAERGEFRKDLYYRMNVMRIRLPSLRERREDIPQLAEHFLAEIARDSGKPVKRVSGKALELLMAYDWPGNVRQLRNELERAAALSPDTIEESALSADVRQFPEIREKRRSYFELAEGRTFDQMEEEFFRGILDKVMEKTGGNKAQAAQMLGIPKTNLYRKLEKYGIPL